MTTKANEPTETTFGAPASGQELNPFEPGSDEFELADVFGLGTPSPTEDTAGEPGNGSAEAPGAGTSPTAEPAPVSPTTTETQAQPQSPGQLPAVTSGPNEPPQQPAAPATPDPRDLEIENLKQIVLGLQQKLEAPQGQKPSTSAPEGGSDNRPDASVYGLQIPDEVAGMMFGEDPTQAKRAIEHVLSQTASLIHKRVQGDFEARLTAMENARKETETATQQTQQQKQMVDQYYASFPAHNNAAIRAVLVAEAGQLSAEYPQHPWDQNFINALGARVNARLQEFAAMQGGQAQPTPAPVSPPAAPAAMTPMGKPSSTSPVSGLSDEEIMLDTFK